jgi:rRNA maturation RNase YbeY
MNRNDHEQHFNEPFPYHIIWSYEIDSEVRTMQKKMLAQTTQLIKKHFDFMMRFSFVWLSEIQMKQQQMSYRNQSNLTDVLTFPSTENEQGVEVKTADILLSMDCIERDAHTDGVSLRGHLAHILLHGMLHALGFDHIKPADQKCMRRLENQLMDELDYPPPWPTDKKG